MAKVFLFLLLIGSSGTAFAQDGRLLLPMIESESKEKAPEWNLERKSANERSVMMLWRAGEGPVRLIVMIVDSAKQDRTWSQGVNPVTKRKDARGTKTKLRGFGSEAFLATDFMKKDWVVLGFRRGRVFAQVYAPSERTVKMFAQIVDQQIAAQSNKRLQRTGSAFLSSTTCRQRSCRPAAEARR